MEANSGTGCLAWVLGLPALIISVILGLFLFVGSPPPEPGISVDGTPIPQEAILDEPTLEIIFAAESASRDELVAAQEAIMDRLGWMGSQGQTGSSSGSRIPFASNQVIVELSEGTLTSAEIIDALLKPGDLELVDLSSASPETVAALENGVIATDRHPDRAGALNDEPYPTILTNADVFYAQALLNMVDGYDIQVNLTEEAAARFGDFTEANIGTPLAIVLDGQVLSIPIVQSRIESPVLITGDFTQTEAEVLAAQLNSDPLPIDLVVESITFIAPAVAE